MDFFNRPYNERTPFTRRYPDLPQKVLYRDAEIAKKIIIAWDRDSDDHSVLHIFIRESKNLSDYRYWELLKYVWILCGSVPLIPMFKVLFGKPRKHKHYFMTPEEAAELRAMPDIITAYRACNTNEQHGISYTIDKEYAEHYKNVMGKDLIIERQVRKSEVFAYINRNEEYELIILS